MRVVVVTWGPGGNLPPMLAAASLLAGRGHDVTVLASGETRDVAQACGLAHRPEMNPARRRTV